MLNRSVLTFLNANMKSKFTIYPVLLAIFAITAFVKVLTATYAEAAHALSYNIFKTTTTKQLLWIINTIFKGNMVLYRNYKCRTQAITHLKADSCAEPRKAM